MLIFISSTQNSDIYRQFCYWEVILGNYNFIFFYVLTWFQQNEGYYVKRDSGIFALIFRCLFALKPGTRDTYPDKTWHRESIDLGKMLVKIWSSSRAKNWEKWSHLSVVHKTPHTTTLLRKPKVTWFKSANVGSGCPFSWARG